MEKIIKTCPKCGAEYECVDGDVLCPKCREEINKNRRKSHFNFNVSCAFGMAFGILSLFITMDSIYYYINIAGCLIFSLLGLYETGTGEIKKGRFMGIIGIAIFVIEIGLYFILK